MAASANNREEHLPEPEESADPSNRVAFLREGDGPVFFLASVVAAVAAWGVLRRFSLPSRKPPHLILFHDDGDLQQAQERCPMPVIFINADPEVVHGAKTAVEHTLGPSVSPKLMVEGITMMLFEDSPHHTFGTLQSSVERIARYAHQKLSAQRRRSGEGLGNPFIVVVYRSAVAVGQTVRLGSDAQDGEEDGGADWSDIEENFRRAPRTFHRRTFRERHLIAFTMNGKQVGSMAQEVEGTLHIPDTLPKTAVLDVLQQMRAACVPTAYTMTGKRVQVRKESSATQDTYLWALLKKCAGGYTQKAREAPTVREQCPYLLSPLPLVSQLMVTLCYARPAPPSPPRNVSWKERCIDTLKWLAGGEEESIPWSTTGSYLVLVSVQAATAWDGETSAKICEEFLQNYFSWHAVECVAEAIDPRGGYLACTIHGAPVLQVSIAAHFLTGLLVSHGVRVDSYHVLLQPPLLPKLIDDTPSERSSLPPREEYKWVTAARRHALEAFSGPDQKTYNFLFCAEIINFSGH